MSFSAQWKADNKARKASGRPERTFEQYKADHARMAAARAARGATVAVAKPRKVAVKPQTELERLQAQLAELQAQIAAASEPTPEPVKRASKPRASKAAAPEFERINHRVDCFGVNKSGLVTLAVDAADARKFERALSGLYCLRGDTYTSQRGERVRMSVQQAQIRKVASTLTSKGLTLAGSRGWSKVGVTL